ncbi:phosphoethanolamine transferase [Massilia sp. W12]|uniref:phosphoethanolamine transferase n=1 Tax=Massilia sp. W12 TaxID=3126507 RepID=UPI0030CE975F
MRDVFRPAPLFVIFTYLLLSAAPFAAVLWGKPVPLWWQVMGLEVVLWLAVWSVFKRPAYFHWLLLPAFIALPIEIYLQMFYGQGISTHHLGIIAETSPRESIEFLGHKVWLLLFVALAVLAWFVLSWRCALRTRALDWGDVSRWVIMALLILLGALWWYGYANGVEKAPPSASASVSLSSAAASGFGDGSAAEEEEEEEEEEEVAEESSASAEAPASASGKWPKLPYWAKVPFDFGILTRSWPFGLMARAEDFIAERQNLLALSEKNRNFRFNARQNTAPAEPQTLVVVIGESSRFDRWSINGYERDTTPLLKKTPNLISMQDMITSVSATRLSVPVILSRKKAMQSLKDGFTEKSFLTAFKEAGFKTWWLSNQISFGHYDTPISVFAKEADVIQFVNLGGFTNESNYDQVLLHPYQAALADPAPKKLIVLHTLGSHWNYSHRHPKEFDKWQPSLFGVDKPAYTDLKNKPRLNNSFDNAILYTDWFLSQVITQLNSQPRLAAMLYVADHGQTLYDGSCNLAFHGHNTQFEFHIPALFWYSDQYQAQYAEKVKRVQKNRKAKLSTENIFHTLLDLGDISYPDEKLEWSFANKKFKTHTRYVDSYGWTNYDNSIIKGACREVIDKDKPLPQEK